MKAYLHNMLKHLPEKERERERVSERAKLLKSERERDGEQM